MKTLTLKLSECKNILKIIAEIKLQRQDAYYCIINGEKVKIVKD